MVICFQCPEKTKRDMDQMLQSGDYRDYADIIVMAVSNLAEIIRGMGENRSVLIGHDTEQRPQEQTDRVPSSQVPSHAEGDSTVAALPADSHMPEIFRAPSLPRENDLRVAEPIPGVTPHADGAVPIDSWIFGQYNRFLPVKANCRALGHLLEESPDGIPLRAAQEQIASSAADLGRYLRAHDQRERLKRDDALSTAFPSGGRKREKSCERYATHFLADIVKSKGQLTGFPVILHLIGPSTESDPLLLLTRAGWEFATLPNPVLDGQQESPAQAFCDAEREFIINHVRRSVPAEHYAYRMIGSAVDDGADTPETLDGWIKAHVSMNDPDKSHAYLQTQRSGVVARMADLGLIARVRDGVRVRYETP